LGLIAGTHALPHVTPISPNSKRGLAPGFTANALLIQPVFNGVTNTNLCLGTTVAPANDVELYFIDCATTVEWWGAWNIVPGENQVIALSGTSFCLDAGLNPHNGGPSKLYTCFPGVPQQNWFYTPDLHIAITGGTQCLDAAVVCGLGGCAPGTEACGSTNTQQWATAAPPPPVSGGGVQIQLSGMTGRCLQPTTTSPTDGTPLISDTCNSSQLQLFDIARGSGQVKLHGTNLCLDAGSNPGNGIAAKLWTCFPGLFQQTWYYTNDNHIAITGGNQCLDLRKEDQVIVQTWQCSGTDPQQVWITVPPT
jgi:hypothetical protein